MAQAADLPTRIGPVAFEMLGGMVAVRRPRELDPLMKKAGGMWERGQALVDPAAPNRSADP